jgi:hypothetical protein
MADELAVKDVRLGIPELNLTNAADEYTVDDNTVQVAIDDAKIFMENIQYVNDLGIPTGEYKVLTKYLAQHLAIMNLKQTTSLSLTNNSESWRAVLNGLGLDQTIPGQNFKAIIRKYTDDFENSDDLANKPQHFAVFFS